MIAVVSQIQAVKQYLCVWATLIVHYEIIAISLSV